jgi:hypothetical protein
MEKYTIVIKSDYFTAKAILQWDSNLQMFICIAASSIIKFFVGRTATKIRGYCSDRNWAIAIDIDKYSTTEEVPQCIGQSTQ